MDCVPRSKSEDYGKSSSCSHNGVPQLCFSVPCLIVSPESNIVFVPPIVASGHYFSENRVNSPPSSCFPALSLLAALPVLFCPFIPQAVFFRLFFDSYAFMTLAEGPKTTAARSRAQMSRGATDYQKI